MEQQYLDTLKLDGYSQVDYRDAFLVFHGEDYLLDFLLAELEHCCPLARPFSGQAVDRSRVSAGLP